MLRGFALALVLLLGGAVLGAPLEVMLDFTPNPNHVPLYLALEAGLFASRGLDVRLIPPSDPSAPVKLCAAGVVDLALTPQINQLIAVGAGLDVRAVGALIDGALGGLVVLGDRGISELQDLRGRRIGYSLEPLEPVLWRTMLLAVGMEPSEYELVYTGMATRGALLGGAVDAIGAFRNFELLHMELLGKDPLFFPQEDYGVPDTYELVFVARPDRIRARAEEFKAFLCAVSEAIALTRADPDHAFSVFVDRIPDMDSELGRRSLLATLDLYAPGARHDDETRWDTMLAFLVEQDLVPAERALEELYVDHLLPRTDSPQD